MFDLLTERFNSVFAGRIRCGTKSDTIEIGPGHQRNRSGKLAVILVFAVILIVGITIYDDYGIPYDDPVERKTTLVNLKYILTRFAPERELPAALAEMPELDTWTDRYYGIAIQLPTAIFEMLSGFRFDSAEQFRIRHLWVFLQYFTSLIFFYHLLRKRFNRRRYALAGVLLLWLSPRIFADSFYNIKDLPFLAWMIISVTFLARWIMTGKRRDLCLFAVTAGIVTNIRVIGGMIVLIFVALVALRVIREQLQFRDGLRIRVIGGLCYGLTWVAITPFAWSDPIGVMVETVRKFSIYPHVTKELYFGTLISNLELPWHYLPVWIGFTSPIIVLVGFVAGLGIYIYDAVRGARGKLAMRACEVDTVTVALSVFPLILAMFMGSTLYNGWRHFYFVYPYLVYLAVLMISRIDAFPIRIMRGAVWGAVAVSLMVVGFWMVRFHPYQMVYYNALIPKMERVNFEKDYWCVSCKDAMRVLLDMDGSSQIEVCPGQISLDPTMFVTSFEQLSMEPSNLTIFPGWLSLEQTMRAFSQADQERLVLTEWSDDYSEKKYLFISYSSYSATDFLFPAYEKVHELVVDGLPVHGLYRRKNDSLMNAADLHVSALYGDQRVSLPELSDQDRETEWNSDDGPHGLPDLLLIELNESQTIIGLTLKTVLQRNGIPTHLRIETSLDGETFVPVMITDASYSDFFFEPVTARYIRVASEESETDSGWHMSEVQVWEEKESSGQMPNDKKDGYKG